MDKGIDDRKLKILKKHVVGITRAFQSKNYNFGYKIQAVAKDSTGDILIFADVKGVCVMDTPEGNKEKDVDLVDYNELSSYSSYNYNIGSFIQTEIRKETTTFTKALGIHDGNVHIRVDFLRYKTKEQLDEEAAHFKLNNSILHKFIEVIFRLHKPEYILIDKIFNGMERTPIQPFWVYLYYDKKAPNIKDLESLNSYFGINFEYTTEKAKYTPESMIDTFKTRFSRVVDSWMIVTKDGNNETFNLGELLDAFGAI